MMARAGITSVHDAYGRPEDLRAYQDAHEAGELSTRVYCLIGYAALDRMIAAGVRTGLGDEWVRVGAMKLICDGSISERTARLSQPYVGRPDDHGILVIGRAGAVRSGTQGARGRLADRHARQRRRGHRHDARASTSGSSASRPAATRASASSTAP